MTDTLPAKSQPVRSLNLLSGGLDSLLAAKVLLLQGVEVCGLVFASPFFGSAAGEAAARQLGIPIRVVDFTDTIIGLLKQPPHGFGSSMNPCIDCHAAMVRLAGGIMAAEGFHFVATGEVLNERPMSQNRQSLAIVAAESGVGDRLLRPLSARLLPETEPERRGWVDRAQLLDLQGRNRKPQMALAREWGITDYPQPAGGCLLTDPTYGPRLKDLAAHEGLDDRRAIARLRMGRHFRVRGTRIIVGRDRNDNRRLEESAGEGDRLLQVLAVTGPVALVPAAADEQDVQVAAALCARYSDAAPDTSVEVEVRAVSGNTRRLAVRPITSEEADKLKI